MVLRYHIKNGYDTVTTIERFEYAQAMAANQADTRPQDKVAYYSRDILGSGLLISGAKGDVIKERHYSPYGEAIHLPSTTTDFMQMRTNSTASYLITNHQNVVAQAEAEMDVDAKLLGNILSVTNVQGYFKGFTSHETLDDLGLVHMNARLYDPAMGRFISPDSQPATHWPTTATATSTTTQHWPPTPPDTSENSPPLGLAL